MLFVVTFEKWGEFYFALSRQGRVCFSWVNTLYFFENRNVVLRGREENWERVKLTGRSSGVQNCLIKTQVSDIFASLCFWHGFANFLPYLWLSLYSTKLFEFGCSFSAGRSSWLGRDYMVKEQILTVTVEQESSLSFLLHSSSGKMLHPLEL